MRLRRILAALVVTVCIGAPILEAFDRWDDTLRDGNDTEANLVIAALCVGMAVAFIRVVIALLRARSSRHDVRIRVILRATFSPLTAFDQPLHNGSPPTALRI